jgi:hypothetical protein
MSPTAYHYYPHIVPDPFLLVYAESRIKTKMSDTVVHIEIYLLNLKSNNPCEKYKLCYEVDDNDENILFSPFIFRKCIRDFCQDRETIIAITPDDLRQRLQAFELKTRVPAHIRSKIENIIKYIEKNQDRYIGISVIF